MSATGNLEINLSTGDVKLTRNINFRKKNPGEAPTAEFEDEHDAMAARSRKFTT